MAAMRIPVPAGHDPQHFNAAVQHLHAQGLIKKTGGDAKYGRTPLSKGQATLFWIRDNFGENTIITENELRVNAVLTGNQIIVNVNQDNNTNTGDITQNLVDKNDMMVGYSVGMFVGQQFAGTPKSTPQYSPYIPLENYGFAQTRRLTSPDNTLLDPVTYTSCPLAQFWPIYEAASLNITINQRVLYKTLFMRDSLEINVSQKYSVNAGPFITAPAAMTTPSVPATSIDRVLIPAPIANTPNMYIGTPFENQINSKSGYQELETLLLLSGAGQNDIKLNITGSNAPGNPSYNWQPAGASVGTLTNGQGGAILQNVVMFNIRGFIVRNVTYKIKDKFEAVQAEYYQAAS